MMKVTIAAVPYSDNLGDGVIADNLEDFLLRESDCEVTICDISYRTEVSTSVNKENKLDFFMSLPKIIRQLFVVTFFTLKYLTKGRKYLSKRIKDADLLCVGGGQLISDVDLNFPIKLYFLIRVAERYNIPTKIISVGVANKWNWISKALMGRVLRSHTVSLVSVRDELSKENLAKYFDYTDSIILPDPALMSLYVKEYTESKQRKDDKNFIGVGIADLNALNYSADKLSLRENNKSLHYLEIIKMINNLGFRAILFTNGATEDERYLHSELLPILDSELLDFEVAERPRTTVELVNIIRNTKGLIAFRLHANIIATSFSIPCFAIGWDNKVNSFFKYINAEEYVFESLAVALSKKDFISKKINYSLNYDFEKVVLSYKEFFKL